MEKEFQNCFDNGLGFFCGTFSCVYCFLSQDGSMSKTLKRNSRESFLMYFKDFYKVRFVVLRRETSAIILHPKD